ncbi:NAD(P)-dependent alcohol dehydrogenase [Sphingomonas sp. TF3]|uniref:NAD(P)-dependent alcohol dehydrogenase n=1 Tax=Sphingomonas sp. TF3 TaxID=2495580 RepID=UPI000F86635D|nr:NAD(P)-dependent alcohol dehydrogenase [Sphingomonas sp. TF3]RUN78340.1 NAD(P)-dependent alcohol dehydrogenase [Sphingomonas sp. TF3]
MVTITAAIADGPDGPFVLRTADLDEPRDHEVLVRIAGVGICHTDLTKKKAAEFNPGVLGHEGAGTVERVGSAVTSLKPGDTVVLSFFACHHCRNCDAGHEAYCENGRVQNYAGTRADGSRPIRLDGTPIASSFFSQSSFATYAIAHENNAVRVESDLPTELLGPLGCGFLTGAGAVINALEVGAGQGIAIFGAGAVGLAAVMAAKAVGANPIIIVDIVPERLERARTLGATHAIKGDDVDAVAEIQTIAPGGVDFTLECVGHPRLLAQAVVSLRPTGVCGLLGLNPDTSVIAPITMDQLLHGRTVKGIIEGDSDPQKLIPHLVDLNRQGLFPFETLIRSYPFDRINDAVADMKAGTTVKPVLILDSVNKDK